MKNKCWRASLAWRRQCGTRNAAESLRLAVEKSADEAIATDNYDIAVKYLRQAIGVATKLHDPIASSALKSKLAEVEQWKKEYEKLTDSLAHLKIEPDDANANLALGHFFALGKGDFDRSLPYLAKGSDAALKELAKQDMSGPTDPSDQCKLGDGWWSLAEAVREPTKSRLQRRTAFWCSKAAQKLKGLAKGEVDARIKEVENSNRSAIAPKGVGVVKMLIGSWHIRFARTRTHPNRRDSNINSNSSRMARGRISLRPDAGYLTAIPSPVSTTIETTSFKNTRLLEIL